MPAHLPATFSAITPTLQPNQAKRGRLFERALQELVDWWGQEWETDWTLGQRGFTWDEAEAFRAQLADLDAQEKARDKGRDVDVKGKGRESKKKPKSKAGAKREALEAAMGGELIRSAKSLQKKALLMSGSRDISAQLFVAVCRALGIGTRLVVSLQPVGWRMGGDKSKKNGKTHADADDDSDNLGSTNKSKSNTTGSSSSLKGRPPTGPPSTTSQLGNGPITSTNGAPQPVRWIDRLPGQRFPGLANQLGVTSNDPTVGGSLSGGQAATDKGKGKEVHASLMIRGRKGRGAKVGRKKVEEKDEGMFFSPPMNVSSQIRHCYRS